MARSESSDPLFSEGLMLDQQGRLAEGCSSNLFWIQGDVLYTPALQRCGVHGIVRQRILEQLATEVGLRVQLGNYGPECLYRADEVFISNSLMGVVPVRAVGCHRVALGPYSRMLQSRLDEADDV